MTESTDRGGSSCDYDTSTSNHQRDSPDSSWHCTRLTRRTPRTSTVFQVGSRKDESRAAQAGSCGGRDDLKPCHGTHWQAANQSSPIPSPSPSSSVTPPVQGPGASHGELAVVKFQRIVSESAGSSGLRVRLQHRPICAVEYYLMAHIQILGSNFVSSFNHNLNRYCYHHWRRYISNPPASQRASSPTSSLQARRRHIMSANHDHDSSELDSDAEPQGKSQLSH